MQRKERDNPNSEQVPAQDKNGVAKWTVYLSVETKSSFGKKQFDEIDALALPDHSPVDITGVDQSRQVTKNFAGKAVDIYYVRGGKQLIGHTTLLSQKAVAASQAS